MNHRKTHTLCTALLGALAMLAKASSANAFVAQFCSQAPPSWNAPKGAVVANQSDGPIRAVLQGVNETLTHTITSNGNGWATHSTSLQPSSQDSCSTPLRPGELKDGLPGFSQAEIAGMYNFLRESNFVKFHHWTNTKRIPLDDWSHAYLALWMEGVGEWLWNDVPYQWQISLQPFSNGDYYRLGFLKNGTFNWMPYNFHQYMAGSNRIFGGDPGWSKVSNTSLPNDRGIVCSQIPAYASVKKFNRPISPEPYSKQMTINAGVALWNAVDSECNNELGYWGLAASGFCNLIGYDVCNRAAWQVVNCFLAGGNCEQTTNSAWNSWVNDPTKFGALSLSPDALLAWSSFPVRDEQGDIRTPWAAYAPANIQWNGSGNVYRCWY